MELINIYEHLNCFNYDHSPKPQIEICSYEKGETAELSAEENEIVFFLKGNIKYIFDSYPEHETDEGKILFLPMGHKCTCFACSEFAIMIFRLYNPIKLCNTYFIEHLFNSGNPAEINANPEELKLLVINPRLWHFITGLKDCISDGIKCKHYFEMKIKEFFLMLRSYYPKSELRDFLRMILSNDIAFSEYVRQNRNKYPTVIALAESMHLTQKQFAKRFKNVFNRTPYEWMKEGRILSIQNDITTTKKSFKQIAIENGFRSLEEFTRFCKKELGKTPTDFRSVNFRK